jgi:hypothetical protein
VSTCKKFAILVNAGKYISIDNGGKIANKISVLIRINFFKITPEE